METVPDCDLLIVWHSRTGAAEQLAHSAFDGARRASEGAGPERVRILPCTRAGAHDLLAARVYLFVCPENLASMTGEMKAFFDLSYYAVLERVAGRAYASIVTAGSDGQGAARQIARIATGWRLREAAQPMIVCVNAQTAQQILAPKTVAPAELARAADLGQALAEAAAMGVL